MGHVMGIAADPDLRKRTYYVLADDYAWGHSCAESFIDLAQKKGIKISNPKYDNAALTVADSSPFISKVSAAGVDGMYSCLRSPVIPRFTKQAYEFGLMKKIKVVAGGFPSEADLEAGGEAEAGMVTVCVFVGYRYPGIKTVCPSLLGRVQGGSSFPGSPGLCGGDDALQCH